MNTGLGLLFSTCRQAPARPSIMECPVCCEEQVIVEVAGIELDMCIAGHGTWFDAQELGQLFAQIEAPELLHDLESRLQPTQDASAPKRRCPRCRRRMELVTAQAEPKPVVLDRCPAGDGLWFDDGELESVLRAQVSDDDRALTHLRQYLLTFRDSETRDAESGAEPSEDRS